MSVWSTSVSVWRPMSGEDGTYGLVLNPPLSELTARELCHEIAWRLEKAGELETEARAMRARARDLYNFGCLQFPLGPWPPPAPPTNHDGHVFPDDGPWPPSHDLLDGPPPPARPA
jgi:hypothetical protein